MVLAAAAPALGAGLSVIASAIASLYGITSDLNDFVDRHIEEMQSSANPTVVTTGRILEAAKFGFGLGYVTSVAIIATGQCLLGNTLAAISTVATAATLTNPIAMTCAAVGAILYGWGALNDDQRNDILDRLAAGLQIGVELIKSVIHFVIKTSKELLDSKALKEFKAYITDKAALFGRTLSDVTHQTIDTLSDAAQAAKRQADLALASTSRLASGASTKVGQSLVEVRRAAGEAIEQSGEVTRRVIKGGKRAVSRGGSKNSDSETGA